MKIFLFFLFPFLLVICSSCDLAGQTGKPAPIQTVKKPTPDKEKDKNKDSVGDTFSPTDSLFIRDSADFVFNDVRCRAYKVNSRHQRVIIYSGSFHGSPPNSISSIYTTRMRNQKQVPLMITNAGMFDPDYSSHGLLISNKKMFKQLDTLSGNPNAGNFYLLPNGVFVIEKGKYSILSTKEFEALYPETTLPAKIMKDIKGPEFATQSGPMLLLRDTINKGFTAGSRNRKIRSGVGILPNGEPVFVISDDEINFYDFALLFQKRFNCKDALFLDGAISKMFIHDLNAEKDLPEPVEEDDGIFGPMIGVIKK